MPVPKEDYTLRALRSEHGKAAKRLEDWENALQIAMGDPENPEAAKEPPAHIVSSVTYYRTEVTRLREAILEELKNLRNGEKKK